MKRPNFRDVIREATLLDATINVTFSDRAKFQAEIIAPAGRQWAVNESDRLLVDWQAGTKSREATFAEVITQIGAGLVVVF